MRTECHNLAAGTDSILRKPHESFDLESTVTAISSQAPTLMLFLRNLMSANRPSREDALSDTRRQIKQTRAAFIVSQLMFSCSQQNNTFQTHLGVQVKFSGLSKTCISIAHDLGISCSNQTISNAIDRVARAARKHAIEVASSQEPFIIVMDNVNLVARVSQAGGGHQNEMHNLTNFIGIRPTSEQARAEFAHAKTLHHKPLSSVDDEDEGFDRFLVTEDDEEFLFDRICTFIARLAAPLFEEAYSQKPYVPLRMQTSPSPPQLSLPRVSVFPVALMDQDENKVDEVVTLGEELVHTLQCDCDIKKAKGELAREEHESDHGACEEEDVELREDAESREDEMAPPEALNCKACCAKRLEKDAVLIFGDGLTVRNLRKAVFLRLHDSGDDLQCIQALPADWHANYELVKIIHKRWFGVMSDAGTLAWLRELTSRRDCDPEGKNYKAGYQLIENLAQLHVIDAIESELARTRQQPQHDLVPDAFALLVGNVCRRLFTNSPESDTSPAAKKARYVDGFLRHAIMMVDMYDAIQRNRPDDVLTYWKLLLQTCIHGTEANYVKEAVNLLDAMSSKHVLPPQLRYLAKHFRNVIISDRPGAPCRPLDHILEEYNMLIKDLIRRSDGKWSPRFLNTMSLAATTTKSAQGDILRYLHPDQYRSTSHTAGDLTSELKNALAQLRTENQSILTFSGANVTTIDPKFQSEEYITGRIKNHLYHLRVERGQTMASATQVLATCDCELCVF
ncbi:hypothetical protein BCR44DRAFT_316320 [Catenaria anguillulae PL171]|uniref:DUF6589 domain-containing protein n=1 Tax=Catenaria anguillulae PL171 TaxID=765915 RepID=A0A1Y2HXU3_9FUNG|nr:hypothetical protein BCR44DRAFT_316320 [Catenaria anguillulae PL171]